MGESVINTSQAVTLISERLNSSLSESELDALVFSSNGLTNSFLKSDRLRCLTHAGISVRCLFKVTGY